MRKSLTIFSFLLLALLGLGACAVSTDQSTVGEYIDDATITARVKKRFAEDETVSAMRIRVETLKGVVVLSGFATNELEKKRAAEVAREVPNVKKVDNKIVVETPKKR